MGKEEKKKQQCESFKGHAVLLSSQIFSAIPWMCLVGAPAGHCLWPWFCP